MKGWVADDRTPAGELGLSPSGYCDSLDARGGRLGDADSY